MATKKKAPAKGATSPSRGKAPAKRNAKPKVYRKSTSRSGKTTSFTRMNPASVDIKTIGMGALAVLAGEVAGGIVAGKIATAKINGVSDKAKGMIGIGATAAAAGLAILKGPNPLVQAVGIGMAVSGAKSAIKTFSPKAADALSLGDGMDLGALSSASNGPRMATLVPMSYGATALPAYQADRYMPVVYGAPTSAPAYHGGDTSQPVSPGYAQNGDDLPAELLFGGGALAGLDFETVM